ncbi:MAG TPA: antitoxin MazE5 [Intrasporangium sp.]|jgi:Arc/MetJ family transcription regulator|uniref:antitoxin MazE5 n=1 Tax=Intrasporangium sp. TaxID=1925024 RepID=UPI002B470CD2|nr:antitoxin MazE5 [Intrasporangium sp.]HKX69071.1 antitoxin MazE5 [Intrasporangium sp.]
MARVRVSTTVDAELLQAAREAHGGPTDASLLEAALRALLASQRSAAIDADYERAYADQPLESPDAWGDLASWRQHSGAS